MRNIVFATDLDNTLLYSKRHRRPGDVCVEWLDGAEQGFFTPQTIAFLRALGEKAQIVPVTTRSIAQYMRIQWPEGTRPKVAVTTNGAFLLRDGAPCRKWSEGVSITTKERAEYERLYHRYIGDTRFRHVKIVDDSYLFVYAENKKASELAGILQEETMLQVAANGNKIYFLPRALCKGAALQRLRDFLNAEFIFAAGDSRMDLPMLRAAQVGYFPTTKEAEGLRVWTGDGVFAEWILQDILRRCSRPAFEANNISRLPY